jgi:CRISPR system Cascade subunit CasC
MTGTLEFTSACYYRYAALNVDLLRDHLKALKEQELRLVIDSYLHATLLAIPSARRNSMNANTVPAFVLGTVKEKGHPIQLVNGFETPVRSKGAGLVDESVKALEAEFEKLKTTWGVEVSVECRIPKSTLDKFCKELLGAI